jgi:DNA-binding transcriptional LysR family regulator
MALDIRLLRPFLLSSDLLSFTGAAEELGIAQSRMSLLIKRLEAQVGFSLFERGYRTLKLTTEGQRFREGALAVQDSVAQLEQVVRLTQSDIRSRLPVASPRFILDFKERVRLLDLFNRERPAVRVQFTHGRSPRLISALRSGEVDLSFVFIRSMGPVSNA